MIDEINISIVDENNIDLNIVKPDIPILVSIKGTTSDLINTEIRITDVINMDVIAKVSPISITVAMGYFIIGGGGTIIVFIPIESFLDDTYIYFVGHYGDDIKVNRWDSENNLEFVLTQTAPTTLEECQALF